jgi:lysophospholipase L1-like esterase
VATLGAVSGKLACAVVVALLAVPASAQALTLQATRSETGWIALTVPDAGDAARVALAEEVGARQDPLREVPAAAGRAVVRHAALWRCDRRDRHFIATAVYPDGSAQTATAAIRTPSCANRFALSVRTLRGRIRARVADRWQVGATRPRVCIRAPGAKAACRALAIAEGRSAARRDYRARAGGLWTVSAGRAQRSVYIRRPGKLRLLATGDSMIQVVDTYLKGRLGKRGFGVRSDARISTGLSKPFLLDWPRLAAKQARGIRPDVTVVFIGANDGFPFGDVGCCGDAWVEAYAKRAGTMMRAYARHNRGLVYWLTLPAPRPAQWRSVYPAVNRAVKRAAARSGGAARVLDIARTFTPGNRFRDSMVWHGRRTSVRQPDGVHLSPAGASIAEALVERRLRKDGVL